MNAMFSLRVRNFRHAWSGLKAALSAAHNLYIHLFFTLITLALGCLVRATAAACTLLIYSTALVWIAELFHMAVEKAAGVPSKKQHPKIELLKDVSAAVVLVAAVASFLIGCIFFIPKVF